MLALFLAVLSVIFFAANAIFCRLALIGTGMDADTFTVLRVVSAACALWIFLTLQGYRPHRDGQWRAGFALFVYMAGFSWALASLSAAVGTLIITVAVQGSMLCIALWNKEVVSVRKIVGVLMGIGGITLLFPAIVPDSILQGVLGSFADISASSAGAQDFEAPSWLHAFFMLCAGTGWGFYSFYGQGREFPALNTGGNFIRCLPFTACLLVFAEPAPWEGVIYALISGAVTSAFGYIVWYAVVKKITLSTAAVIQLGVPPIAMLAGMLFLGEAVTARALISTFITLSAIAFAVAGRSS